MSRNWTDPMQWDNTGVEPSSSLKQNGFTGGQKPPATVFNYLFNKIKTWVTELQGAVNDNDAKEVGKKLEGQTVSPTASSSVTAGDGAEIFNDYRTRTQEGLIKSGNIASGSYSHAEGEGTTASGVRAHAEGAQTNATGVNSHAEGGSTFADGSSSHAEGMLTHASGVSSHAEGSSTFADGSSSHAEGMLTHASGVSSHAEGNSTTAVGNYSHIEGESSNNASSDYTNETTNNTIIKAWNTNKFSLAKGVASHIEGKDCLALGDNSHAEGNQTTASGTYSHAEGLFAQATGDNSHAEGAGSTASGSYSHAEGEGTTASGEHAHAEGVQTNATGVNSHAEGAGSTASGVSAHAEGSSMARGDYSHAKGSQTTALGDCSCAEGESYNLASEDYTYNTNLDTIIDDWKVNRFSLARGKASHCEGTNTLALGDRSHSMGIYTVAKGVDSYAGGFFTTAKHIQFVTGKYNTQYNGCENSNNGNVDTESQLATQSLFIIGNGTSTATSNAFRVTSDGQCHGTKAFSAQGADFAEYFEWEDENPNNEDRRGKFVSLNGEKIKLANDGDYILGIVSATGAFIGNSQSEEWQGKYLKDVYGDWLTQTIEVPESTDADTGETVPAHTVTQYVVNPDFNPSEKYVSREFRKEWSPVGMLGQITLVDDGTCVVNGYCKPSANGVGTSADNGYRVLSRIDNSHVKVLVK